MAPLSPVQEARRARVEGLIALAAPLLDLVLAVGDRVSRIAGPDDDPLPIRPASERVELGAAARAHPPAVPEPPREHSTPVD